jgi:hypothetical protein
MRREQHPVILQIVRFGLPIVVAVYYVTAARGFAYTADEAYSCADWSACLIGRIPAGPAVDQFSPFWSLLVALGGSFGLDPLLTAKIMSLVFGCFALLALYLLGVELLDDRILAFCAALVSALDPWLLQMGPSGTAATSLVALSLATLFFIKREDYALATLFAGLCTLIAAPSAMLFLCVLGEIWSSREGRKAGRIIMASGVLYFAVVLPWIVVAVIKGHPILPQLRVPGDSVAISWLNVVPLVACAAIAAFGAMTLRRSPLLRQMTGGQWLSPWVWVAWTGVAGLLFARDFWLAGVPVLVLLAMQGVRIVLPALREENPNYSTAFLFTAALFVLNQTNFLMVSQDVMARTIDDQQDVAVVAQWIRAHLPAPVAIESAQPGSLGYQLKTVARVLPLGSNPQAPIVHAARAVLTGYDELYRPSAAHEDSSGQRRERLALFQRHSEEGRR